MEWLEKEKIDYQKRYIDKEPLSEKELLAIMSLTENGFEDIFSFRSMKYLNLDIDDINALTVKELVTLMIKKPTLIRKPFSIKENRLIVGYGVEQVQTLLPKARRAKTSLRYR